MPYVDDAGNAVKPDKPNAVKLEQFVFDAIPLAKNAIVYTTDRAEEFSPGEERRRRSTPPPPAGATRSAIVGLLPQDGSGRWTHWSRGVPTADTLIIDLYPDLSELDPDERCEIPGMTIGGKPAYLFSSRNRKTVSRHFRWMKEYGLDGVLVQRFVERIARERAGGDVVLKNIMAAREGIRPDLRHRVRQSPAAIRKPSPDAEGRLGVPCG